MGWRERKKGEEEGEREWRQDKVGLSPRDAEKFRFEFSTGCEKT